MDSHLSHVAIIMDGNGRWAKNQNKDRSFGHLHGTNNVRNIAIAAEASGISTLTLYAFSTENWQRSANEINYLMKLPAIFFDRYMKELMDKNIKINLIGHLEHFPEDTKKVLLRAIEQSKDNTGMVLNFAMDYGAQDEIVHAIKDYTEEVISGARPNDLDVEGFSKYLMTSEFGDVDLMIRTSGEMRLSNFLLWQSAYAELMFVEKAWPDFTPEDFKKCVEEYYQRDRRFGGVK
ncbi:MAG: isoprenyl transferase [Erysipelothrix sp.]|nr:isoprenyl transferase [Erysipelothrix sp.]